MKLICDYCKQPFERKKVKKAAYHFCCVEHHQLWRKQNAKKKVKCLNCGKLTDNPKFCSGTCAATYNNKKFIKRKRKKYFCKACGISIPHRRKYCDECNPQKVDWSKVTLKDIKSKRKYQAHSQIRDLARQNYLRADLPKECKVCGYSTFIEICHIKAIKDFDEDTPVSVINNTSNLVALCPNHHKELDNGLITL